MELLKKKKKQNENTSSVPEIPSFGPGPAGFGTVITVGSSSLVKSMILLWLILNWTSLKRLAQTHSTSLRSNQNRGQFGLGNISSLPLKLVKLLHSFST